MHPETLLPQPVLLNAALYAAVALVYSAALFIIDHTRAGSFVFKNASHLRDPFGYVAICSWPVLLFGGLILVAVRVGANVRKSNRRRRRRSSRNSRSRSGSASRSRSRSQTPSTMKPRITSNNMPRSSSAPPAVTPPPAVAGFKGSKASAAYRKSAPSVLPPSSSSPVFNDHPSAKRRHYSDYAAMFPHGVDVRTAPLGGGGGGGGGGKLVANASGRSADALSKRSSKRSKASLHGVPRGYVSVTRAQKAYAAIGFMWVCIGLAATSCLAGVVFAGQRERLLQDARALNDNLGIVDWLILIFTGLIFVVVFAVLAVTTAFKAISTMRPTPQALEMRTVSLDDEENGDGRGGIIPPDVSDPVFGTHAAYMAFSPLDAAGNVVVQDDEEDEELILEAKRRESALLGLADSSDISDDDSEDSDYDDDGEMKADRNSDEEARRRMRREVIEGRPLERFSMPGSTNSRLASSLSNRPPLPPVTRVVGVGDGQVEARGMTMVGGEHENVRDGYAARTEDWRSFYRRGIHLPYQPDEGTVERMMRQLRDMGFRNAHENIAALQASSFDLEIASDKLANAHL